MFRPTVKRRIDAAVCWFLLFVEENLETDWMSCRVSTFMSDTEPLLLPAQGHGGAQLLQEEIYFLFNFSEPEKGIKPRTLR